MALACLVVIQLQERQAIGEALTHSQAMEAKLRGLCAVTLVLLLAQRASSQGCTRDECVLLTSCPALHGLLRNPTIANIKELQRLTCFIKNRDPFVCCPEPPTEPPPVSSTVPPVVKESLLPEDCGHSSDFKVVGGEDAPIDAYPWQAVLGYSVTNKSGLTFECGGSVISDRYILTAAHCVNNGTLNPRNLKLEIVRLGEWDLSNERDCVMKDGEEFCAPPVQDFGFDEVIEHRGYNSRTLLSDDIALIRLNRSINFFTSRGYILPVCLPTSGQSLGAEEKAQGAIVSGWGVTEEGAKSQILQHLYLPFVDSQECNDVYRGSLVSEQICMGGEAGKDSCQGDSGGPLVVKTGFSGEKLMQIGLVSYGPTTCGIKGFPGVYTSISHYRSWIEENLRI